MYNILMDYTERTEDEQVISEELKGHVRAIEAILLELADADTIRNAKARFRRTWKNKKRNRLLADVANSAKRPYDEHAEAALDALIYEAERTNS